MTVKLSHDRKVRSLAKKTLGSTRVGSAMRLPGNYQIRRRDWNMRGGLGIPGAVWRRGWVDMMLD